MSLRLGLFYPNARTIHAISGPVAARNPDILDMATHVAVAQAAEEIGLDYLFLADAWGYYGENTNRIELQNPMLIAPILAAALIPATKRIRLITTIHTAWFNPVQFIRVGGALDALSAGRWGMNMVSGSGFADQLSGIASLDHDARYEMAAEFMEVVTQFWSTGQIDVQGKYFQIKGTLVGPRTVQQPRPLVVSAGASDAGRRFAGRYADYIFMPGRTPLQECQERVADIRRNAAAAGRPADAIKMQMHASIAVRETDAEAKAYSEWIAANVDLPGVADYLNAVRANISTYDDIYNSLGELQMRQVGSVSGARKIHGGPEQVADGIEKLATEFGCAGVAVTLPVWTPKEIRLFGRLVLPVLERRGLWTHPSTRGFTW
ncbi:MAG: LLM class flavin-dependent oxidoreductase [Rhodospirillales bacterium]